MSNRGFAAMDKEKVREIAKKGGEARKEKLGSEGYARIGQQGGEARKQELGSAGYATLGQKGREQRKQAIQAVEKTNESLSKQNSSLSSSRSNKQSIDKALSTPAYKSEKSSKLGQKDGQNQQTPYPSASVVRSEKRENSTKSNYHPMMAE